TAPLGPPHLLQDGGADPLDGDADGPAALRVQVERRGRAMLGAALGVVVDHDQVPIAGVVEDCDQEPHGHSLSARALTAQTPLGACLRKNCLPLSRAAASPLARTRIRCSAPWLSVT